MRKPLTLAQIARAQAAYKQWAEVALRARAAGRLDLVEAHRPPDGATATAIRRCTRDLREALGERSPSKYRNVAITRYNIRFDSLAELRRYEQLRLLQIGGAISDLRVHPRYVVAEAVAWCGRTLPKIVYEADFEYSQNGNVTVEDVKGAETRVYVLKRQLFLLAHPGVVFVQSDANNLRR